MRSEIAPRYRAKEHQHHSGQGDLATPGLRESWDAGNLSRFHGWDKRAGNPV
jgi:hypothetical protein